MMTYERRIDALGGTAASVSAYDMAYNDGHSDALEAAIAIGQDADTMIAELMEALDDILLSRRSSLSTWVKETELLLSRIRARQA